CTGFPGLSASAWLWPHSPPPVCGLVLCADWLSPRDPGPGLPTTVVWEIATMALKTSVVHRRVILRLARRKEPPRVVIKLTYAPVFIGHMDPASVNIAGLLLALLGILLLFRYGMSYRVRTDGEFGVAHEAEPNTKKRDDVLGWIGLMLVV